MANKVDKNANGMSQYQSVGANGQGQVNDQNYQKQDSLASDAPELMKANSRVSQRSKPANFYSNMNNGIQSDVAEAKDF